MSRTLPEPPQPPPEVPSSWVTVLTTEHYNLQTQRAATITETNGRASIYLGAVSAGLIAVGFSIRPGPPTPGFVAFGVLVSWSLAFLGLVTVIRTVQTSIDDAQYAERIEILRDTYAELLPALAPALSRARGQDSYLVEVRRGVFQRFVSVSASLAVITGVLAGTGVGLLAYGASGQLVALIAGGLVSLAAIALLFGIQRRLWIRSGVFAGPPQATGSQNPAK